MLPLLYEIRESILNVAAVMDDAGIEQIVFSFFKRSAVANSQSLMTSSPQVFWNERPTGRTRFLLD